jgi:hypothetical protein
MPKSFLPSRTPHAFQLDVFDNLPEFPAPIFGLPCQHLFDFGVGDQRRRMFYEIVDFGNMDKIITVGSDLTLVDLGNHDPGFLGVFFFGPAVETEAAKTVFIRR